MEFNGLRNVFGVKRVQLAYSVVKLESEVVKN